MKKRDKMKMMGILILLLAVITVAITLILVSRLSKTAGKDQKEETFDRSVSGMLSNAYILKSEEKDIIVLYRGETYLAEGKPEKKYTGVADIELTKGKVTKIYTCTASTWTRVRLFFRLTSAARRSTSLRVPISLLTIMQATRMVFLSTASSILLMSSVPSA